MIDRDLTVLNIIIQFFIPQIRISKYSVRFTGFHFWKVSHFPHIYFPSPVFKLHILHLYLYMALHLVRYPCILLHIIFRGVICDASKYFPTWLKKKTHHPGHNLISFHGFGGKCRQVPNHTSYVNMHIYYLSNLTTFFSSILRDHRLPGNTADASLLRLAPTAAKTNPKPSILIHQLLCWCCPTYPSTKKEMHINVVKSIRYRMKIYINLQ